MVDTPSDAVIGKMLAYGRLLDGAVGRFGRRFTDDAVAEIKRTEEELVGLLSLCKSKSIQAVLDFNHGAKPLEVLALRIVCCVAHGQISGSGRADVRTIVQAVGFDDDVQPVRARQVIFRLCVRRILVVESGYLGREQVTLGKPLLDLLRGSAPEPVFVTREAVRQAQIDQEVAARKRRTSKSGVLTARQIFDQLSQSVAGQYELKMALAVAGRQTLLRCEARLRGEKKPLPPKSNVLVIGPSGTGKTHTCQSLSRILGLPFASVDASQITASGYVGDDLAGVLYLLSEEAARMGVNPEAGGLVYVDEADKISKTNYESATTVGVQFEMLRLLDGGQVSYPTAGLNKWGGSGATMDTSGLLVVASGAFSWLHDEWNGSRAGIGFGSGIGAATRLRDDRELLSTKGGMVVELMNRFTAIVRMQPLTAVDVAAIVQNKFGPLAEYKAFLEAEGRTLSVDADAALAIGGWSVDQGLMGRGPKTALEMILRQPLFTGEPRNVIVTRSLVEATLCPATLVAKDAVFEEHGGATEVHRAIEH